MYELRLMKAEEVNRVIELLSSENVFAPDDLTKTALVSDEVYLMLYFDDIVGIIWISGNEVKAVYIHDAFIDDIESGMFNLAKKTHHYLYGFSPFRNEGSCKCFGTNDFKLITKYIDYKHEDRPGYIFAWGEYELSMLQEKYGQSI